MRSGTVVVVSGLPRSGTSMTMRMLAAGGLELVTDARRAPDHDNPLGYFEDDRVKDLARDVSWLGEAEGKAIKIVSALLKHLPRTVRYKVIFMRRHLDEVMASQNAMLARRGKGSETQDDVRLRALFAKHLDALAADLAAAPHIEVLYLDYDAVVADPAGQARAVSEFLGGGLDVEAMAAAVEPAMRRQRRR
jgi:hypothetical protein